MLVVGVVAEHPQKRAISYLVVNTTDSVVMGSPSGPVLANIFMLHIYGKTLFQMR